MHWNHRLIRHTKGDESWVSLHEVFYDENKMPIGYSEGAVGILGVDADECLWAYKKMAQAFEAPVLADIDFPEGKAGDDIVAECEPEEFVSDKSEIRGLRTLLCKASRALADAICNAHHVVHYAKITMKNVDDVLTEEDWEHARNEGDENDTSK